MTALGIILLQNQLFSFCLVQKKSRFGPAVRRKAGEQKDLGSIRLGSLFSSKIVVYGHCLVTLPTLLVKH